MFNYGLFFGAGNALCQSGSSLSLLQKHYTVVLFVQVLSLF